MTVAAATRPMAPHVREARRDSSHPEASPADAHTADTDDRWVLWVARGVESDRRTRAGLVDVAWLAGSALLVALAFYITLVP
jgi:hypothetical protein